jgi:hypothetical protein
MPGAKQSRYYNTITVLVRKKINSANTLVGAFPIKWLLRNSQTNLVTNRAVNTYTYEKQPQLRA